VRRLWGILLALLLTSCGLANEPPIVVTAPLPTITPTPPPDVGRPSGRIDLARAAAIFGGEQGCAACHGVAGLGDGLTAGAFTCPMPRLADPTANRSKTILAWFAMTTNGNNGTRECLMPAWNGRLDEQARWEVTNYAYALQYKATMLQTGAAVWAQTCAACHGAGGKAASGKTMPDFSDAATLITLSDTALFRRITVGISGVEGHAFSDTLSEDQRWAVAAYTRSLAWDHVEVIGGGSAESLPLPAATEDVSLPPPTAAPTAPPFSDASLTVRGKITAGTAGAALSLGEGLPLQLEVITPTEQGFQAVTRLERKSDAAGAFSFPNVPRQGCYIYVVSAAYNGITQIGTPRPAPPSGDSLDLVLPLYDLTDDPAVVEIEIARLFIDFIGGDRALVEVALRYRTVGDRLYQSRERGADGRAITFRLPLPREATGVNLSADQAEQFTLVGGDSPAILSTTTLPMGVAATLQFQFLLETGAEVALDMPIPYRLAELGVNVPGEGRAAIRDPRFLAGTPIALNTGVYDRYDLREPISGGGTLSFVVIRGETNDQRPVLAIVITLMAFLLGGTAGIILLMNRRDQITESVDHSGQVAAALAALERLRATGRLSDEDYESRRGALEARDKS